MTRTGSLIAVCALALSFCPSGRAQDSPSLGDVARQAQKDKASKPVAKVITNDDMPSTSRGISSALGAAPAQTVQTAAAGKTEAAQSPAEAFQNLQSQLDQLDSMDRATLVNNVLQGNTSDFPGRARWEEKLFAAKQTFVSHSRDVLQRVTQLKASADATKGSSDPNDPGAKTITAKVQQLIQEAEQASASFRAVIEEGKDLAAQPAAH
jgi:hypothetical protein